MSNEYGLDYKYFQAKRVRAVIAKLNKVGEE